MPGGRVRSKIPQLELALEDRLEHHRFLLRIQQRRLAELDTDLTELEQPIQEKLKPYATQLALLDEIPGVDWTLAAVIIAELGVDMSVFGSVSQAASRAGVCSGNYESADKCKNNKTSKGNLYLKTFWPKVPMLRHEPGGLLAREVFPSQSPARTQARRYGHCS